MGKKVKSHWKGAQEELLGLSVPIVICVCTWSYMYDTPSYMSMQQLPFLSSKKGLVIIIGNIILIAHANSAVTNPRKQLSSSFKEGLKAQKRIDFGKV